MGISKEKYEELLKKEKKRRKSNMRKYQIAILISVVLLAVVFFINLDWIYRIILMIAIGAHGVLFIYLMIKNFALYLSLTDELHIEGDKIVKYNPDQQKSKMWIKIDDIDKVYMNIEKKPNTFYIVYEENGERNAEGFYKERIPEKERFLDLMKERDLLEKERISFAELKDIITFGEGGY